MQKQLLIVNTDAVAISFAEIRAGKLGFIEEGAIVAALTGAEAQVAVGNITSNPFKGSEVVSAIKVVANAGTAGTGAIDLTAPIAGTEPLYVKLINTTVGTMDVPIKNFEASTLAGITALINADGLKAESPFLGFTAVLATNTITVTAPINSTFRLAATDGSVITYPVSAVPSTGQDSDVIELEDNTLSADGITNRVGFPVIRPASKVEAGATYVVYTYHIAREVPNKAGTGTRTAEQLKLAIAVKTGLTVTIAALDGDAVVEE